MTRECVFCGIAAGRGEASVVFEDETVVAFMDLNPVTPGHLLVVPRMPCEGIEVLRDGAVAFQTVFHFSSARHSPVRGRRLDPPGEVTGTGAVASRRRCADDPGGARRGEPKSDVAATQGPLGSNGE
ncbi:HIT family protein [Actinoplanes utahensis]